MSDESKEASGNAGGTLRWVVETVLMLVAAVVLALLVRQFVAEPFEVPTGSMLDTIQLNDIIWTEKVSYRFRGPNTGEIITFNSPEKADVTLVKRVIATGGQTVDLQDGHVLVDGVVLDEPYVEGRESVAFDHFLAGIEPITYPYRVPEGHVWVMGDNRTNSRDSRYFGAVALSEVTGRAVFVSWPPSDIHFV